ncbi:MAG: hypothetical protein ABEJ27_04685 [Halodesulfurarchaeum sp.]
MTRPLPAVTLVLLLLLSGLAVAEASPHAEAQRQVQNVTAEGISANTTDVLVLDTIRASGFARADLVVTRSLSAQANALRSRLARYTIQRRYQQAPTAGAKRRVLRNATDRVAAIKTRLIDREDEARRQYIAGSISAKTYLEVLGQVDIRARQLLSTLSAIESVAPRGSAVARRVGSIRADLQGLQGPIRKRLAAAVHGEGASARTYVAVSDSGVVLAQLRDGSFARGAYRADYRDTLVGSPDLGTAQARLAEIYPWAWNTSGGVRINSIGLDVLEFEKTFGHGSLTGLLDTSSGMIYREYQVKTLASLPSVTASTTTVNNTTLAVSRTYAGGPIRVRVTNATGAPRAARVLINGTLVGATGGDGVVWGISPYGTFNVTAVRGDLELRLRVSTE